MAKIWVKAAHPRAHFYQEVLEPGEEGRPARMVIERVFAPTFLREDHPDHMVQIPVPMQVTDTLAVRSALRETFPLIATDNQPVPASLIQCLDDEVSSYLKNPWHLQQAERDQLEAEKAAIEKRLETAAEKAAEQRSLAELTADNERLRARLAELEAGEAGSTASRGSARKVTTT